MNTLIPVGDLIRQSWDHFLKYFKENARIVLIAMIPSIILGLTTPAPTLMLILALPLGIASFIMSFWMAVVLGKQIIKQDGGSIRNDQPWTAYFLPLLWIGILVALAVGFGFVFLIIPGIWLSVSLAFSQYLLIEDDIHGTHALQASMDLVKGRWWATFGRVLVMGIVFGFAYAILLGLIVGILTALKLPTAIESSLTTLLTDAIAIVLSPLFVIAAIKLFHSLKKTKVTAPAPAVNA